VRHRESAEFSAHFGRAAFAAGRFLKPFGGGMTGKNVRVSQGKRYLTPRPLAEVGDGGTLPQHRAPKRGRSNQNAVARGTVEANRDPLRAVAGECEKVLRRALGAALAPAESQVVARNALQLYADAVRHVGVPSPFVSTFLTRYATNSALASHFMQRALELGAETEKGQTLIEMAHRCEARAERGMVAAEASVRAFVGKDRGRVIDVHAAARQAFGDGEAL
jgi:hypothetical protein